MQEPARDDPPPLAVSDLPTIQALRVLPSSAPLLISRPRGFAGDRARAVALGEEHDTLIAISA